jgi:predicted pyridoxine 5'-phosphate oxidase superfamily flavin-nucleotide-binding protein
MGSRSAYARRESGPDTNDRLGRRAAFIAERDGFYIASVSETGWPYVQFRGARRASCASIDDKTLGYADFRGNRQYVTIGNVAANDRVSLFLMDYVHQQRLKIFGRLKVVEADADPALAQNLSVPGYPGRVERAALITVEAFDWNCPQHITPRFTEAELAAVLGPVREQVESLKAENERLRDKLATTGAPAS